MAKKTNRACFVALLGILCFVSTPAFAEQLAGCPPLDLKSLIGPSDPAYAEATEFRQTLEAHGIVVRCALRSKWALLFRGQKGAVLYNTDQGDFDALFLPKTNSWTALEIVQTEKNGRYLTSFRGHPKPWHANLMDGSRPEYFVKHANALCVIWGNKPLSAKLDSILNLK